MAKKQIRIAATSFTTLLSLGLATQTTHGQQRTFTPSYESAPTPIKRHNPNDTDASWLNDASVSETARKYLNKALRPDGLRVEALHLQATQAELRFRNNRYNVTPQAFGRAARAMANILPSSVSTFVLTPVVDGIPVSSVTLSRTDLEAFENHPNGTKLSFGNAIISDPILSPTDLKYDESLYPKFTWSLGPYVELHHDDLTSSNQYSVRARANADWHISPCLLYTSPSPRD